MKLVAANKKKTEFSHITGTFCLDKVRDKINLKLNHTSLYLMRMTCLQTKGNALIQETKYTYDRVLKLIDS